MRCIIGGRRALQTVQSLQGIESLPTQLTSQWTHYKVAQSPSFSPQPSTHSHYYSKPLTDDPPAVSTCMWTMATFSHGAPPTACYAPVLYDATLTASLARKSRSYHRRRQDRYDSLSPPELARHPRTSTQRNHRSRR